MSDSAMPAPPVASAPARPDRLWRVGSALIALLALAPIAGLVFFASRGSGELWPHLIANVLPVAARTTALLLVGVGILVTVLGIGTAWLVTAFRFPGRRVFEWALLLPLSVPSYVMAFAYLDVVHPVGPLQTACAILFGISDPRGLPFPEIRSLGGAILLLGLILYPYVYLPVRALFVMQSASMLEASRTLGAGRFRAFCTVALPLARPAVAVGVSLALMEALNDIGASEFLGVRTLTVAIYTTWVTRSSIEGAAQIALVMLAIVFALVLLERLGRRRMRAIQPRPLHGAAAWAGQRRSGAARADRLRHAGARTWSGKRHQATAAQGSGISRGLDRPVSAIRSRWPLGVTRAGGRSRARRRLGRHAATASAPNRARWQARASDARLRPARDCARHRPAHAGAGCRCRTSPPCSACRACR
jgi:ABC-type sulfate transport system permease component